MRRPLRPPFLRRARPWPHVREAVLVIGAYYAFLFTRAQAFGDVGDRAFRNAERVIDLETSAGFFWEAAWQRWALDVGEPAALFFNWSYILTFMPVAVPTAIAVYVIDRERYRFYRNVVIATMAIAVVVFAVFPLAPPRLIPGAFVDTLDLFGPAFYTSRDDASYFNEFAAMPSVHFSWTLVFGVLFFTSGPRWLKVGGVAYPALTLFAITITGNHYILDAAGGALLMLASFGVAHGVRWALRPRSRVAG